VAQRSNKEKASPNDRTHPVGKSKKRVRKTKDKRRDEIVQATVRLLGDYGVQGTTVSRIASAVGLTKGAIYQHFPNLEAVLAAALEAMDERSSAWIAQSSGPDVPQRLVAMSQAHSSWASSEYNTFVRPFFQLITAERESNLATQIVDRQQRDLRLLVARAEEGQRQGSISREVDPEEIAWTLQLLAWADDIAMLMGLDDFAGKGMSTRILRRLMDTYTP
jgi:AcrR family transcriptional regulator